MGFACAQSNLTALVQPIAVHTTIGNHEEVFLVALFTLGGNRGGNSGGPPQNGPSPHQQPEQNAGSEL